MMYAVYEVCRRIYDLRIYTNTVVVFFGRLKQTGWSNAGETSDTSCISEVKIKGIHGGGWKGWGGEEWE